MMKTVLLAGVFAAAVAAQTTSGTGPTYVTVTYDDCPSETEAPVVTVTQGVTSTYCSQCTAPRTTTVYTTTYLSLCTTTTPHAMTPATYTVTETCDAGHAVETSGHIPPGFTVTTAWCHACATPGPVTITEPCGCDATNGVPAPTGGAGSGSGSGSGNGNGSGSGSGNGSGPGSDSGPGAATDADVDSNTNGSPDSSVPAPYPGADTSSPPGSNAGSGLGQGSDYASGADGDGNDSAASGVEEFTGRGDRNLAGLVAIALGFGSALLAACL